MNRNIHALKTVLQAVLATSMPLKDDSAIKEYLLHPDQRTSLLAAHGASVHCLDGADALQPLLAGRCFVCLHYKLGPLAALEACLPDHSGQSSTDQTRVADWCVRDVVRLHASVDKYPLLPQHWEGCIA